MSTPKTKPSDEFQVAVDPSGDIVALLMEAEREGRIKRPAAQPVPFQPAFGEPTRSGPADRVFGIGG